MWVDLGLVALSNIIGFPVDLIEFQTLVLFKHCDELL